MSDWHVTSCPLCAQNCGLRVQVEGDTIIGVRGDKANPRSRGYVCRKGLKLAYYQHHDERLRRPLKRMDDGFVEIPWEQAFAEIGERLRSIVDAHGPRSFALVGGGGQGSHFEAAFGTSLMQGLGSKYHYSAIAQELTGYFWGAGRMLGRQNRFPIPDEHRAEMLLAVGWNGVASHQMPRAPLVLKEFSRNPEKRLVVIDPRRSETAELADVHLALRPGTDALLARAMIAIILAEGWEDREYLSRHTSGFEQIRPWFEGFDVEAALAVCELTPAEVRALCKELSTRAWCMHFDLGVYMNRHSTLATYLYLLLGAVCGRLCVRGGNVIPGSVMPLGLHSDERKPETWRTVATDVPAIFGLFPPNVLPEEILSGHEDRVRAVVTSWSNPLVSYADTDAYERAFRELDLLVVLDVAMTETAELAHYVLPVRSSLESFDATFFTWTFPEVFFQMRRPVVAAEGEPKEAGEVYAKIAEAAGVVPPIPEALRLSAGKDRLAFTAAFLAFARKNPKIFARAPLVLGLTLGEAWGSAHLAALWGMFLASSGSVRRRAARAGFPAPPLWRTLLEPRRVLTAVTSAIRYRSVAPLAVLAPRIAQSERLFDATMERRSGLWIGEADAEDNFSLLKTDDGKVALHIPEMAEWVAEVTPEREVEALEPDADFPMILNAGRHKPEVANTIFRNPAWSGTKRRGCTAALSPEDAERLGVADRELVRVVTERGSVELEAEVTSRVRAGQVLVPHGFGLTYRGEVHGVNVNRLTAGAHRDRLAGTPIHRYVPCRVERIAPS